MAENRENQSYPLVTVVIATYNSSRTLELAIRSVLAQDFSDFEVWVVGDGCSDNSQEVVISLKDQRLHWTNLAENTGCQGAPNNEGIRRAKGRYIAYLGHDDLWFPWHLSRLIRFLEQTRSDLVHPLSAVLSPSGLERIVGPPGYGRTYKDHAVTPSCWLHRKELVQDCGYWGDHLQLNCGVDLDFSRRIHLKGKKIAFCPVLSHLKFPAHMWGLYAADYQPGQLNYFNQLTEDPEKLEKNVLNQAAVLAAQGFNPCIPASQAFKEFIKTVIHRMLDFYGKNRWPLKQIWKWHFWRKRKKELKKRGLVPRD